MDRNTAIRVLVDQAIGPCMNGIELSASLLAADHAIQRARIERDLRQAVALELADKLTTARLFEIRDGRATVDVDEVVAKAVEAALAKVQPKTTDSLSLRDAAKWLGISESTLKRAQVPRVKVGRSVRYAVADLQRFQDEHRALLATGKVPRTPLTASRRPAASEGSPVALVRRMLAQRKRR